MIDNFVFGILFKHIYKNCVFIKKSNQIESCHTDHRPEWCEPHWPISPRKLIKVQLNHHWISMMGKLNMPQGPFY